MLCLEIGQTLICWMYLSFRRSSLSDHTCAQQQLYFNLLINLITIHAKINDHIDVKNISYAYVSRVSCIYRSSTKSNNLIPLRRQFKLLFNILSMERNIDEKSKNKDHHHWWLFNTQHNYSGCLLMCKFVTAIGNWAASFAHHFLSSRKPYSGFVYSSNKFSEFMETVFIIIITMIFISLIFSVR